MRYCLKIQLALVMALMMVSGTMWSCKDEPPPKPQVVRKKIILPSGTLAKKEKNASKTAVKRATAPQKTPVGLRPKSDIANPQPAKTSPKVKPQTQTSVAQAQPPKKQPSSKSPSIAALRPKSDISQPEDGKTSAGMTAKSEIAQTGQAAADAKPIVDIQSSQKAPAAKALSPTGMAKEGEPSPYAPAGKIDPFEPLFKETVAVAPKKEKPKRPRTPLERMALNQLKLVAIVMSPSGNRAMVQESSGKGYIIKQGTYIGLNSGKVVEISKDKLIIEEQVENLMGEVTVRKKELVLPKPRGEF